MAQRQTGGRSRALVFLVVSGTAAFLAVAVLYRIILGYQRDLEDAQRPPETLKVVVAMAGLNQGITITPEMLNVAEIEPAFVPDNVFHDVNDVIGRVPAERIIQGEYIRMERLADPNAGIGLNAIIPRGQRAISIGLANGKAVSGFLNPGNYVDILLTIQSEKLDDKRTVTMLQAVKVLAVNSRLSQDEDEGKGRDGAQHGASVMIALTPEDAEKITHASNAGVITLTLRNDVDVTKQITQGAHVSKLLGKEEEQVKFTNVQSKVKKRPTIAPAAKPADTTLTIIKGSTETTTKIKAQ
jgi:pilus assembly protein CpaB